MSSNEKLTSLCSLAALAATNTHAVTKDTIDALLHSLGKTAAALKAESLQRLKVLAVEKEVEKADMEKAREGEEKRGEEWGGEEWELALI